MSDYSYTPPEKPSIFLRLKTKGDKILVRLGSAPFREPKIWKAEGNAPPMDAEQMVRLTEDQWRRIYRDPEYNVSEVFHWKVIDRDNQQAKIYTGTPMIYNQIKKFADTAGWGDPRSYDLQIERTEKPGSYYEVTPMPDKTPITDRELYLLEAVDLAEKIPGARHLSETQVDHISEMDGPAEPAAPIGGTKKQVDDIVIEDIGDDPITLDDIPF